METNNNDIDIKKHKNWWYLILLILSGEAVFILPFVLPRIFRATVLDVFSVTNLDLGTCFSVYGLTALLSYLLGGPVADKFSPRKLIAISLWSTALGGFILLFFPSLKILQLLYGYWGFTSIFLFWSPMIKATRVWGENTSQGKAFGFLDGGRGLVGALFGSLGVFIFSLFLIEEVTTSNLLERKEAFKYVILLSSIIIIFIGVLVWFFLKPSHVNEKEISLEKINTKQIISVLKIPSVWLLMVIILCAYFGYKTTDILPLYAKEVMNYNEIKAAKVGAFLLYIRPIIGVLIGFIADQSKTTLWLIISFIISIIGALLFVSGIINPNTSSLFIINIFITATGIYALRSLYFAVMQEGHIPITLTGTAVGLISVIGFTPDIFAGLMTGYLLDTSPGKLGHVHVFILLTVFCLIGLIASLIFYRLQINKTKIH